MKAVRFHQHGGPEVLVYEEVEDPRPGKGEALVRVKACALNHLDIWARKGLPNVRIPLPHISGSDIAGTVEWAPEEEKDVVKGMDVIVSPGISCGRCEKCFSGRDNQCRNYSIIGYQTDGGYAELVKVPVQNLMEKPKNMNFIEASSFPLVFLTAYHMLINKAHLEAGEYVLVLGAGSGVGIASIQIAKLYNAHVIATAGDEEKLRKAEKLGADYTINHYKEDVVEEVRKITAKKGADVVVEHVGKATWERSIRACSTGGRIVTCGATTGPDAVTDLRYVFNREITILGSYMGSKAELMRVVELFKDGKLKPVVDSVFPLKEADKAQRRMEESLHFGKIVLQP
jgi:NADPH:quinone reductase-like Zn-dependent oxidoreductase